MNKHCILIVDDQVELAENLAEVLQGIGFATEIADSAEAGLARIHAGGVEALITDFKLPGRTGAQLIEAIRSEGARIPALVMSAFTDDRTIEESRAAGAWMFLPKPVPLATLMQVCEALARAPVSLLVDDETSLTENLAEALARAGHEVLVTGTAAEALAIGRRLDSAVVDYGLPDGNGTEVARTLRARDPAIRLLFVSGHMDEIRRAALSQEFTGSETMEKPLDPARIVSWVERACKPPG